MSTPLGLPQHSNQTPAECPLRAFSSAGQPWHVLPESSRVPRLSFLVHSTCLNRSCLCGCSTRGLASHFHQHAGFLRTQDGARTIGQFEVVCGRCAEVCQRKHGGCCLDCLLFPISHAVFEPHRVGRGHTAPRVRFCHPARLSIPRGHGSGLAATSAYS